MRKEKPVIQVNMVPGQHGAWSTWWWTQKE
jgi:hypothetical protein